MPEIPHSEGKANSSFQRQGSGKVPQLLVEQKTPSHIMTEDLNQDLAIMMCLTQDEGKIGDDFMDLANAIARLNNNREAGMIEKSIKAIKAGVPQGMKGMRNLFRRQQQEDSDTNENIPDNL